MGTNVKTNVETVRDVVEYIEEHLEESLELDGIAGAVNYSKYHLSRMFAAVVGISVHAYIQRRRLTEAARKLVFTEQSVLEIAMCAGYETQRSFTGAFKKLFRCSPHAYRKRKNFYPVQLMYSVDGLERLRGDRVMDIRTVDSDGMILVGYRKNTRFGFHVMGTCWRKMHGNKHLITDRCDMDFLVGLNDYSNWDGDSERQPAFDYVAAAEVHSAEHIPNGMERMELPAGRYVVFCFTGKREDSLQPVVEYVYQEWFLQSTCRLNENARYDFAKYGETVEEDGTSRIEYWVPVLKDESGG